MAKQMIIRTHLSGPSGYRLSADPAWHVIRANLIRVKRLKSPLRAPYGLAFALCLALMLWACIGLAVIALR